ncbi:MAG: TetR/AcrR family transcriptional regulator [Polaromonas sp.]|uniref:TetR/AcrR family transcriptional regulator n=1 Tax=Polaromonas sp. TaxID=1869339 RepID=UPI002487852D|nr:TetR/AcrR family transcriptional regulator [Polaromonas sp.]MDI1269418.1 TetR/AcrR family transcriptional regulator [Polaromonas sp.]
MRPVLTDEEVTEFRADVCRVAEVLFARHGVDGVTMRQIAAELDCSPTTAYRYFKNKEEILAAVRAAAFNRFCGVIEEATRSSLDPRKSARNVGQAYLNFALENPDAYRMMFDVSQAAVIGNVELTAALARARRSMLAYVAPMIDKGILRGETHALGQMMWASAHGLVMLRLSGVVADDAELRQLHERTMSALVRGTHQLASATPRTSASELISPVPARKAIRKAP